MNMVSWLSIFIVFAFCFSQEPCEGHCLSQDELNNIMNDVKELEFDVEKCKKLNENLNSQIYMYIQSDSLYMSQIGDLKKQLQFKEEMIDLVKPKWYDNKYLWFFGGILVTSGSIYLAGQLK